LSETWAKKLKGLTLTGPFVAPALALAGYRLAKQAATVADLFFPHAAVLTEEFVTQVMGGEEALRVLEAVLKKAQKPTRWLLRACPIEYVVYTVLGNTNAKSV
jgi:hypothetical protein